MFPAAGFVLSGFYNVYFPFFFDSHESLQLNILSISVICI